MSVSLKNVGGSREVFPMGFFFNIWLTGGVVGDPGLGVSSEKDKEGQRSQERRLGVHKNDEEGCWTTQLLVRSREVVSFDIQI